MSADIECAPQESWYEKLNRWDEALEAYERKYRNAIGYAAYMDAALGRLRWAQISMHPTSILTLLACTALLLLCDALASYTM